MIQVVYGHIIMPTIQTLELTVEFFSLKSFKLIIWDRMSSCDPLIFDDLALGTDWPTYQVALVDNIRVYARIYSHLRMKFID